MHPSQSKTSSMSTESKVYEQFILRIRKISLSNARFVSSPCQFPAIEDRDTAYSSSTQGCVLMKHVTSRSISFVCLWGLLFIAATLPAMAQQSGDSSTATANSANLPDNPAPNPAISVTGQQTKRILFVIPNFRSVSVDQVLPPQSPKEKFKLMIQESFDYSSFIYVGVLAGAADIQKSYPEFGDGADAYGRYYWHGFADNLSGNFFTEAALPVLTHEDPRYYTLGRGGVVKRTIYSISRLAITRSDLTATNAAHNTLNISEIVGNGAAAGISGLYYPSKYRTWTKTGQKWILQIGLDGASNIVKEFWPDINHYVFRGSN